MKYMILLIFIAIFLIGCGSASERISQKSEPPQPIEYGGCSISSQNSQLGEIAGFQTAEEL